MKIQINPGIGHEPDFKADGFFSIELKDSIGNKFQIVCREFTDRNEMLVEQIVIRKVGSINDRLAVLPEASNTIIIE